jgi:hypothetical protein
VARHEPLVAGQEIAACSRNIERERELDLGHGSTGRLRDVGEAVHDHSCAAVEVDKTQHEQQK